MATISSTDPLTGDVKTEEGPCGRHSPDRDRPDMSELRIVLLGRSGGLKSKVGNIILGTEVFETQPFLIKQECVRARGLLDGTHMAVINTADLLHPQISQDELDKQIELCVCLSDPGPHVILLVLPPEGFTQKNRDRMRRILHSLSDQAFNYTIALIIDEDERSDVCISEKKDPTEDPIIKECRGQHYMFSNIDKTDHTQMTEFMEKMYIVVKENEGRYLTCDIYKEVEEGTASTPEESLTGHEQDTQREIKPQDLSVEDQKAQEEKLDISMAGGDRLNLVLFGSTGTGKTSAGNAILGQRESSVDSSSSSVCERRQGEVCGRLVTVVEMPALCESQLTASTVSRLCASLCGPGVHAFLLVSPAAPLTDEDKAEITKIREIFGSRVIEYMMVLFTHESPTAELVLDFLQQNKYTRELLEICSNRFFVFNDQDIVNNPIVPKLLKAIEEMNRATESCFSLDMYLEAQLEKVRELEARHKMELEEKDRKIRELEQNIKGTSLGVECKDQSSDCVRIMLVGKTGCGKSATGNTILHREEFKSEASSKSVTTRCKKGVGEVDGKRVAVVDTPGLFDTSFTNEEVQQEIAKCISFLAPGPHVFLLVLQIGRFTKEEEETLQVIKSTFGKMAEMFTMVLFTRGDDLNEELIEEYIQRGDPSIQNLIQDCGNRFHVFNNENKDNRTQLSELLKKIDMMVEKNGGGCYTNEMFQEAERTINKECERILRKKEEEMQREKEGLKAKHEEEIKKIESRMEEQKLKEVEERNRREKELKDKEEHLRKECEEWKKREQEEKERRDEEEKKKKEKQELEWMGEMDKIEKERTRMKEEWKRREDEEKNRVEREEKQRQEMIEKQIRERKEFEEKQAEENEKRDREKQERKNCEKRERREWEQKMKDAKKEKKEIQEDMKKRAEEQLEKVRELEARHKMELEEKDRKIRELEQNIKGTSLGVECKDQSSDCVRIVLVGKTGCGKSATGNTILHREEFKSETSSKSVTTRCKKGVGEVDGKRVAVVDTPGLFDTSFTNEEVQQEIAKCISFLAPGPHVFLLVLQIGRFTNQEKEIFHLIKSTFGKNAEMFTIVIFTRGDDLNESIENYIQRSNITIQSLIQDCGNRFHVFNNKDKSNCTQVSELLDKIDSMVRKNGGGCYTNAMFQEAEMTIKKECERILREKEEEMQREREVLKAKHEEEMKKNAEQDGRAETSRRE